MAVRLLGVLLVMTVLSACGLGAAPLPTATAVIGSTTISLPRGSYCWSSGGQGTCADSAPPDMLLQTGYLKPVSEPVGTEAVGTEAVGTEAVGAEAVGTEAVAAEPAGTE